MSSSLVRLQKWLATSRLQHSYSLYKRKAWRYSRLSRLVESVICVDIGAAHFPHPKWWLFLQSPKSHWLAIDPAMESLRYTENWRWKCSIQSLPVAVGAKSGSCTLYATNSPTGSSVLRPRSSIWTNYRYSAQDRAYFFPVTEIEIKSWGSVNFSVNSVQTQVSF